MKTIELHIARGRHNVAHQILVLIDNEDPFISGKTPRDLGGLVKAGFSMAKIASAQRELIEREGTVLGEVDEGIDIDENYVRGFLR